MEGKTGGVVVQAIKEEDFMLILNGLDALTEKLSETDEDIAGDADAMKTLEAIYDLRDRIVNLIPTLDVARAGLMPEALKLSFELEGKPAPAEFEYRRVA
jgi:hypothetical protein